MKTSFFVMALLATSSVSFAETCHIERNALNPEGSISHCSVAADEPDAAMNVQDAVKDLETKSYHVEWHSKDDANYDLRKSQAGVSTLGKSTANAIASDSDCTYPLHSYPSSNIESHEAPSMEAGHSLNSNPHHTDIQE